MGGTEVYTRQLVRALGRAAPDHRFVLYLSREAGATPWDLPSNVRISVAPCRAGSRIQRVGWELTGLVATAMKHRVALMHSLGTTCPLWAPFPQVVTVHDLIFEVFPEDFPGARAGVLKALVPRMLRRARRLFADSAATAGDLVRCYGTDPARIDVVHLGPGRSPTALTPAEAERARATAGASGRYLLSVATTHPHKNLSALVNAFREVRAAEPDLCLLLVGGAGTGDPALRAMIDRSGLGDSVVLAGRVSDATLDALYAGAEIFIYPSLYEGFGLPLLEAMERGVPVLSSTATSLPEVGGDAVAYVDATRPDDMCDAIRALLADPARREQLAATGREQAQRFSWVRAAGETLAVYDRVLDSRETASGAFS